MGNFWHALIRESLVFFESQIISDSIREALKE